MHPSDLIAEFALRAGLPDLRLSTEGTAAVIVDDITLQIEHDPAARQLVAYASLGEPAAGADVAFYRRLLQANAFGAETGGAAIGLDGAHNELLISRTLDVDCTDYAAFEAALESLVDAAERMRAALAESHEPEAPAPAWPAQAGGAGLLRA